MARKATGQVIDHQGADGSVYRALRFRAYGERRYVSLGRVSRDDAERTLRGILADVERGIWQPAAAPEPPPAAEAEPTLHELAEGWLARARARVATEDAGRLSLAP
jgi:hypothetical protein